jgi:tetratricopeptide (TPR) repeat protein
MTIDVRNRRSAILIWVFLLATNLIVFPRLLGPRKIVAWWILMFLVMFAIPAAVMGFRWAKSRLLPILWRRALGRGDYDRAWLWLDRMRVPAEHEFRITILLLAGRPKEAEERLRKLADGALDHTQQARRLTFLAEALMDQGGGWQLAKEALEQAIRLDIGLGGPFVGLAEWYLLHGAEPQRALDLVEQANTANGFAALQPSVRDGILAFRLATKALALAFLGRHHEAELAIAEAFRVAHPKNVSGMACLHWSATTAFAAMGQLSKAREHSKQAAAIDPHGKYGKLAARWESSLGW